MNPSDFPRLFQALTGQEPLPWRGVPYLRLFDDDVRPVCDVPTAVGQTAGIALRFGGCARGFESPPLPGFSCEILFLFTTKRICQARSAWGCSSRGDAPPLELSVRRLGGRRSEEPTSERR